MATYESDARVATSAAAISPAPVRRIVWGAIFAGAAVAVTAQLILGLLGTGIGMSIAANRNPKIRAALCADTFSARMTRMHNDANVLCLGARVVGGGLALDVLDAFLDARFEGGRHAARLAKIDR